MVHTSNPIHLDPVYSDDNDDDDNTTIRNTNNNDTGIPYEKYSLNDSKNKNPSRESIPKGNLEDIIVHSFESICALFDNIYFLKNIGIINENNFLYKKLNKSQIGSKIWLITLILSLRKSYKKLKKTIFARIQYKKELKKFNNYLNDKTQSNLNLLKNYDKIIINTILDFFQDLFYMIIIIFDILKTSKYQKLKSWCEYSSYIISILRIFNSSTRIIK
ncbi:similar to Zygosaccharomyces rouxii ZYRO0F18370g hypothetical protein [Maudiozyma saulgeensis]|uniref:Uncharacterized protein n=1 Tax=Maudiozyma saulgeensis TaxID=1789683 RepID=A0A1X7R344_9SACH|nr:similar to Zygosaccharomyces rouxii ZYRO0F18370g hypothetical protein [Kazachstania saulgeensis]